MPLFGHRRATPGYTIPAGFTGPAEFAAAQGWAPVLPDHVDYSEDDLMRVKDGRRGH